MLKPLALAISVSLLAVACGGGAPEANSADDAAKKDAPAADAKPAEGGDAAKPAEGAAPAGGDAAKPAEQPAAPK